MKKEKVTVVATQNQQTKIENSPKIEKLGRTISRPVAIKKSK